MAKQKKTFCFQCGNVVEKDVAVLNMKLINRNIERYMCKQCLAEFSSCTEEDLDILIEQFREQGCLLFE